MKKPLYTNDKKAPRMKRHAFTEQVVTRKLYRAFKKKYPEYREMSWHDFYQYWQDIAATICNEMITNPLGVKLGSYTGELKYQYTTAKFKAENISASNELGERVNYVNLMTKGKVGHIRWERRWAVKFNKMLQFYAFEEVRSVHDDAKKHILAHPEQLRVARSTRGGYSVWRQLKNKV